jgi:hypothetical protein
VKLLHSRCGRKRCVRRSARDFRGVKKGPDWPGLEETAEETMLTISITFIRAATGIPRPQAAVSTFWLLVFAVAILDDAERRDKEQRRKRECKGEPIRPKPRSPAGPR